MKARLSVKQHDVSVSQVPLNDETGLDQVSDNLPVGNEFEADSSPIWTDDV